MYGVVYTTSDFAGNALWLTPEQPDITPLGMARSGMLLLPLTIGVMAFRRFLTFTAYAETCHKQTMNEPHWYLLNLGVDPTNHGRGIGSALMQPVFAQADAHHVPCYLETNNPRNLPFYERHGFHVAHAGEVPHGGPQFWAMIRPPQRK
jgi:ribosomal protein S18 acetylase RimI-like enzyme